MPRKRDGFVPISKVDVRLPGIEGRGRSMSAQTRHHFTTLRQINQLIEASAAEPDLGFMARLLALCSLPRTNQRDRLQYERSNGPYKLCIIAGSGKKQPFGNVPRLLLAWVCSEAVRTQSRELVLGRSLYEFMRKLGMADRSGSARGDRARLKNQMRRLFTCSVQLVYAEGEHEVVVSSFIAERADFWWSVREPDAPVLWDSTIKLGEKFFQEIIAHPGPARHAHPQGAQAVALGIGFVLLARVSHVRDQDAAHHHVAATLPAVRCGGGAGGEQKHG